jgi:hypothetical protein
MLFSAEFSSLTPVAAAYMQAICAAPAVQEWLSSARQEDSDAALKIAQYDALRD